jgi:hypothetical protein
MRVLPLHRVILTYHPSILCRRIPS